MDRVPYAACVKEKGILFLLLIKVSKDESRRPFLIMYVICMWKLYIGIFK